MNEFAVGEFYAVINNHGKICEVITENEKKTKEELLWFYNHRSNEKLDNFQLVPCKVVLNKGGV